MSWSTDGCYQLDKREYDIDLINVPEPEREMVVWLNIYESDAYQSGWTGHTHKTRKDADGRRDDGRVACVRSVIKYRPGQFDEDDNV